MNDELRRRINEVIQRRNEIDKQLYDANRLVSTLKTRYAEATRELSELQREQISAVRN